MFSIALVVKKVRHADDHLLRDVPPAERQRRRRRSPAMMRPLLLVLALGPGDLVGLVLEHLAEREQPTCCTNASSPFLIASDAIIIGSAGAGRSRARPC